MGIFYNRKYSVIDAIITTATPIKSKSASFTFESSMYLPEFVFQKSQIYGRKSNRGFTRKLDRNPPAYGT